MMKGMIVLTLLLVSSISAFAEMGNHQGGGMMSGGWWWGMNSAYYFVTIIAGLIVLGVYLIMKRR